MSKLNGLSPEQDLFMIMSKAKGQVEDASSRSTEARNAMEDIQNSLGSVLGALGGILKGVFTKGGAKGGGKGG